jgi:hypothetical protein
MTTEFENADCTHKIEGTDDLLMSVIVDQAADLEHGWREAVQNGVDSPGSRLVTLEYDDERTVVSDDGDGVDLTADRGIDLLTNLGESSKSNDESAIGEFGIGKGQIIAMGRTTMRSGDTALIFDIKEHGLKVGEIELDEPVDGLTVEVEHYEDETPRTRRRWETYEERISDRFKYTELTNDVEVQINGETVSDGSPEDTVGGLNYRHIESYETEETGTVYTAVGMTAEDPLKVYSNGVYVKDVDSGGLGGVIVTNRNLDLNFARNDIKAGCPVWKNVNNRIDEIRQDLFEEVPDNRLTNDARRSIAEELVSSARESDEETFDRFADKNVFRTADESWMSASDVDSTENVGYAEAGDPAADKLSESLNMTVLDKGHDTVQRLLRGFSDGFLDGFISEPETFDPREKAEELGMFTGKDYIPVEELSPNRRKRLKVARRIANRMGINRDIQYGESDLANAWTDGHTEIVITDGCMPSGNRLAWMPELFETLVHEFSHTSDTSEGCASHGRFFDEKYRKNMESMWPKFSGFMAEASRSSVKDIVGDIDL